MMLSDLKFAVDAACEAVEEDGRVISEVPVSVQMDTADLSFIAESDIEVKYDNDVQVSGCCIHCTDDYSEK